ncbi:Response regulator receiver domain-containing protein [Tistlia consotensis]|uniref:Response regulator receiver domain-containing protein n=1 Tax=Tistlia consotensis USBA 355 TaxID=560819 RepID=A0A1Y6CUZ2_9PROT|nr:response regulator [Tistlia consotensis]SMF78993.1 Response regulator receiver domain-containing protein [Tistlia consotensis USBA 355]SNS15522.1 Response regulator receiver domain-containing protein [Tistlia consotensis]
MAISHVVEPQLPHLRRFARALTGDQVTGDNHVEAVLQTVLARPELLSRASDPRVALYRILLSTCRSLDLSDLAKATSAGERTLRRMTPLPRQAFLLHSLEGLRAEQVAEAMAIGTEEAERLIETASHEIARQLTTRILIIEDEPVIALDLEALVEGSGHSVAGIASTHREALELAEAHPPGLVLADVQLADKSSGLDAVNDLLENLCVPVIFITAYPERLLSGRRPEPAFVVTKPYSADTVLALISQALFFGRMAQRRDRIVA